MSRGKTVRFDARETIVSAGALHSPALLLRAGIGPAEHLRSLGIEVVADLPGVGSNLLEHASVSVAAHLKPGGARAGRPAPPHLFRGALLLRPAGMPAGRHALHADQLRRLASAGPGDGHDAPGGQQVLLAGHGAPPHPLAHDEPRVDLNMLSDERDLVRLVDGFRRLYAIMESDAIRDQVTVWFPAGYSDAVRRLMVPSAGTWLKTAAARALLDLGAPGRMLLRRKLTGGRDVHRMVRDESALADWVKASVWPGWHVCGTCRMGPDGDPLAVLDGECRVRGVAGLRVVDASVMPTIPRANTNLTTIAIAEKIADGLRMSS